MTVAKYAISFEEAKARYVHRFTMEHVPQWTQKPFSEGKYPAPQFASDEEWYQATEFPTNKRTKHCQTWGLTWPLGETLSQPYRK